MVRRIRREQRYMALLAMPVTPEVGQGLTTQGKIEIPGNPRRGDKLALGILLAVFLFVVLLIAAFIFPPSRWVKSMTDKKDHKKS
jgi:hypothetical protein